MRTLVGTFLIEDIFYLTGRGLVLLGELSGHVAMGNQLVFSDTTCWDIKGVEFAILHNRQEKIALLVHTFTALREELVRREIIGGVAQIFAS